LGNGISILIFAGIVAGLPSAIGGLFELVRTGAMSPVACAVHHRGGVLVTYGVVFVERGQRKILVNYAKRQVGNKVYGGQSSHLPLKLNMSGVIPPIFASSIILLPATDRRLVRHRRRAALAEGPVGCAVAGPAVYVMLYAAMIVFFCFFYTALVFNSRETADNLKKSGAFIPGIRPGEQTAKHIDKILSRLTLAGAIYITAVCLLPEFLVLKYNVPFYFGGTSLLDHRGRHDGLLGAGAELCDESAVREPAEEGEFQDELTWPRTTSSRCRGRFWRTSPMQRSA
jgi:preprotein translocase subunit SecY